jgi:hypothetical protein
MIRADGEEKFFRRGKCMRTRMRKNKEWENVCEGEEMRGMEGKTDK